MSEQTSDQHTNDQHTNASKLNSEVTIKQRLRKRENNKEETAVFHEKVISEQNDVKKIVRAMSPIEEAFTSQTKTKLKNKQFPCSDCEKSFPTFKKLESHTQSFHSNQLGNK